QNSFKRLQALFAGNCISNVDQAQSFYFPGEYSVDGCLRSCYQDSVHRHCDCMDPQYARKPGVKSCTFEKLACIDEMTAKRGDPYYWTECRCGLPCGEEEYRYETSRSMKIQRQKIHANSTNSDLTSDITIFFATMDVNAQAEEWTFPVSRVLGLTGGFAGVLMGASVVFVIEIILLVVRLGLIGFINVDTMMVKKMDYDG
ncbi:hypothetical protein PMAYCL1PPCAC_19524, partial [Pristionchus mayeri]